MKKLFFAWAADAEENHRYLQDCIAVAAANVGDYEVIVAARNAKQAGAGKYVLEAIDGCDLFIADVSLPESHAFSGHRAPDPNMLYELGYALRAHGLAGVHLIGNSATTQQSDLPFELQRHKALLTHFEKGNQQSLIKLLEEVLYAHSAVASGPRPHIYVNGFSFSPVNGFKLSVRNDEEAVYYLENVEIAGIRGTVSRSLRPHATTADLHVEGLLSPQYADKVDVFSFIVFQPGNDGQKYKVYQKLSMTTAGFDEYVISAFDDRPLRVERVQ